VLTYFSQLQETVVTIGFWRWCITLRNIGFSDSIHRPGIKNKLRKTRRFGNLICFRPQVRETPIFLQETGLNLTRIFYPQFNVHRKLTNQKIFNHFGQLMPLKQFPHDAASLLLPYCSFTPVFSLVKSELWNKLPWTLLWVSKYVWSHFSQT
jgi:hypothetical protein